MYRLACTPLVSRTFFADVFFFVSMPTAGVLKSVIEHACNSPPLCHICVYTVNITFLYLLLRRAECLGQEERFL